MKLISQKNLLLLLLIAALLPFLGIAFYCHPSADDFAYAWSTKHVGIVESCKRDYLNWNGRYFSNLLVFLNPISFNSFFTYQLVPVFLILFTLLSILTLVSVSFQKELDLKSKFLLSLFLLLLYLQLMPQLAQGIYWYTGAVTYQFALIGMLLYVSFLIRFVRKQYFMHAWIHVLFLLLLLFICIGCNEITMLQLVLLHVVLAYKLKQKAFFYLVAISFIFSLPVILSPGNEGRGANFVGQHQLIHSGFYAILQTFRFSLTWLSSLCLFLTSLLFIPFAIKNVNAKSGFLNQLNLSPLESLVLLFILVFSTVFPPYWSMGILGQHRTVNCACFLFVLFWFVHLFVWIKKYAASEYIQILNSYVVKNQKVLIGMAWVAFIVQGNFAQVCSDLIKGKASGYNIEMQNRYEKIKECKNAHASSCVLDSLSNKPKSIFNLDISEDENNWINKGEAAYFEIDHINLK